MSAAEVKAEWRRRRQAYAEAERKKWAKSAAGSRAARFVNDWWQENLSCYKDLMADWSKVTEEDIPW